MKQLWPGIPSPILKEMAQQQVLLREQGLQAFRHDARRLAPCGKDSPNLNVRTHRFETAPLASCLACLGPVQDMIQSYFTQTLQSGGLLSSPVLHTTLHCTPGWHHCFEEPALPEGTPEIRTWSLESSGPIKKLLLECGAGGGRENTADSQGASVGSWCPQAPFMYGVEE